MKVFLLNLPYRRNIIRKYSCSYYANGFLYPPMELIRVANIIQKYALVTHEILFTDAIAEHKNLKKCLLEIENFEPDIIITITSVDFINEEYRDICTIKKRSNAKLICIGYLPDLFPLRFNVPDLNLGKDFEGVIHKAFADFTGTKPEELLNCLKSHKSQPPEFNPDVLESIDFSFVNQRNYNEFQTRGKTAFTYFSFGCPYQCTFCIRTYNLDTVYLRNQEYIFEELLVYHKQGISNIRILDDNIPLKRSFLIALRDFMKEQNLCFRFYGLSRIDLLDEETIILLKEIGFHRILIGLETINTVLQEEYHKNIRISFQEICNRIRFLHVQKIKTAIFILFNPLKEGRNDVRNTLKFLKQLPVDFASMSQIVPYPGTDFFNNNKDEIEFQLIPTYESTLKTPVKTISKSDEYLFFLSFYVFNKLRLFKTISWFFKYPAQSFRIFMNFSRYLFVKSDERKDLF